MRTVLTSILIVTLVTFSTAWPQGRSADALARAARTTTGDDRRGPLPLRADGAVPPPAIPARPGPGRLRPRPVVGPVVVVPDGRGPGGRPGPPRPLPVLDLRLLDGRPDPVFGLAAAARPRRGAAEVRPRRDRRGVRPDGRRRAQHGRAAGEDDGPGQRDPAVAARQRPAIRGTRGRPGRPRPVPPRPLLQAPAGGPPRGLHRHAAPREPRRPGPAGAARRAARPHPGTAPGGLRAADGPQRTGVLQGTAARRACRPASTSWSGGRPSSPACRSWGWPRGSRPTPSSRTGATRPGPAAATASSPTTAPTSTGWRPRSSCRPATCARATPP